MVHIIYSVDEKDRICDWKAYEGINKLGLDKSHTMSYLYMRDNFYDMPRDQFGDGRDDDTKIIDQTEIDDLISQYRGTTKK